MPRRSRRFYLVATLAYLAVISALVGLALFGRGSGARVGDARVSVRYRTFPLFGSAAERATVSFRGLQLRFDRAHPLVVGESESRLREVRTLSEGVDLGFEDDLRLQLRRSEDGYSLAIDGLAAGARATLSVPFRVSGATLPSGDVPAIAWNRGGQACFLSLPPHSAIDLAHDALDLAFDSKTGRELRFGSTEAAQDLGARWLTNDASLVQPSAWQEAVSRFRDAAWTGWVKDRLSQDGTLWRAADGSWTYVDAIGPALLAESIARGSYLDKRGLVIAALSRQLGDAPERVWTLSATPFAGWLSLYAQRSQAREGPAIARIKDRVAASDPGVFATSSLVPFLLDHGVLGDVQELMAFAARLTPEELAPASAVGVLEAWLDYAQYVDPSPDSSARSREIVQRRIFAGIRKSDQGLFLASKEGKVDLAVSIACGQLLERAASLLGEKRLVSIGRTLVASAVRLVRPEGFLPATLTLGGDQSAAQDGTLAPEAVYYRIGNDRYLPREVPLYRSVGAGAWVWTAARIVSADSSSSQVRLSAAFPPGFPHYLLLFGLRPFKELELHGAVRQADPGFAQYADGWMWDKDQQVLFVKLTGKQELEQIVIRY